MKSKLILTVFGLCTLGVLFILSDNAWANADLPDVIPFACSNVVNNIVVGNPAGTVVKGTVSFVTVGARDVSNSADIDVTVRLDKNPLGGETVCRDRIGDVDLSTNLAMACRIADHFFNDGCPGVGEGIINVIKNKDTINLTDGSIDTTGDGIGQVDPACDNTEGLCNESAMGDVRMYLQ